MQHRILFHLRHDQKMGDFLKFGIEHCLPREDLNTVFIILKIPTIDNLTDLKRIQKKYISGEREWLIGVSATFGGRPS